VYCSALQRVAVVGSVSQCKVMCCSVLRRVLRCVAVCGSELQCVAVRCSASRRRARCALAREMKSASKKMKGSGIARKGEKEGM